ncbi:hypothetical protein BDW74DRAFT_185821 [Aspergillus multicolor]|uniref:Zn(II)2Cys6 transcription factor n=1 Tax=Aspergillus multicolor TaxID=41759 RepID=UPI003CCD0540
MADRPIANSHPARQRVRAGKACTRCHEKRIKCDAVIQMPCSPCLRDRHAECVLRQTKRGTYSRSGLHQKGSSDRSPATSRSAVGVGGPHPPQRLAVGATADATVSLHTSSPTTATRHSVNAGHDEPGNPVQPLTLPTERLSPVSKSPLTQPSSAAPSNSSHSYQDISWSAMFDHVLNNRQNGNDWIDKCSITYLGESFPLATVLGGLKDGSRPKLHHIGPPFQSQPAHMLSEDLDYLRAKGVFTLPDKAHMDALIAVFLDRVYPLYPVVNRQEFILQYEKGELPLILTYAVCFIAVTFAPQSILNLVGFQYRPEARSFFYKKAKALFDMGHEKNKITVVQSTFFLSFYGGGPNTYWNFYSLVSTAVTIAEAIGIHRSTIAISNISPQDKSLMRRIWWSLVNRDSICGTLVGRPFRIDLDQADADMLTIEDFAHDAPAADFLENLSAQKYAQYQIETAKLSLLMRYIIISRFYPGRLPSRSGDLYAKLLRWKAELSPVLAWDDEAPDLSNFFSMSLSVQYSHHSILLYLGHPRGQDPRTLDAQQTGEIVDIAAHHISTVVCGLATKSALLNVPHELYHGVFLAQAAFYERTRSPDKLIARLGRTALNSCQVVLQSVSEFWDCGAFIVQLFENLSSRALEQPSLNVESFRRENGGLSTAEASAGVSSTMNSNFVNDVGIFNALLGDDRWQGNPMLENLFDLPPELFLPE